MCVVTGSRSEKGAFEETLVTNAVVAAKALDQSLLYREHFVERQELDRSIGQVDGRVLRSLEASLRGDPLLLGAADVYGHSR